MSIVDEEYCACGKKWTEESPDCVFNYHPKPKEDNEKGFILTESDIVFLIQMMRSNYEIQKLEIFKTLEGKLVKLQKECKA